MKGSIIVVDDFYYNPDKVREYALSLSFDVNGNYPGVRTKNQINDDTKQAIQDILWPVSGNVTNWLDRDGEGYTGAFQVCTVLEKTWIHQDDFNNWAGVLYLSPEAPSDCGTSFYKHKSTGAVDSDLVKNSLDSDGRDYSKWEEIDVIKNRYNRLILFRANQFHASSNHFGTDINTGRMTQTFFIQTER